MSSRSSRSTEAVSSQASLDAQSWYEWRDGGHHVALTTTVILALWTLLMVTGCWLDCAWLLSPAGSYRSVPMALGESLQALGWALLIPAALLAGLIRRGKEYARDQSGKASYDRFMPMTPIVRASARARAGIRALLLAAGLLTMCSAGGMSLLAMIHPPSCFESPPRTTGEWITLLVPVPMAFTVSALAWSAWCAPIPFLLIGTCCAVGKALFGVPEIRDSEWARELLVLVPSWILLGITAALVLRAQSRPVLVLALTKRLLVAPALLLAAVALLQSDPLLTDQKELRSSASLWKEAGFGELCLGVCAAVSLIAALLLIKRHRPHGGIPTALTLLSLSAFLVFQMFLAPGEVAPFAVACGLVALCALPSFAGLYQAWSGQRERAR